jgi:hypothetical protein
MTWSQPCLIFARRLLVLWKCSIKAAASFFWDVFGAAVLLRLVVFVANFPSLFLYHCMAIFPAYQENAHQENRFGHAVKHLLRRTFIRSKKGKGCLSRPVYQMTMRSWFNCISVRAFFNHPSCTGISYNLPFPSRGQNCRMPGTITFTTGRPTSARV